MDSLSFIIGGLFAVVVFCVVLLLSGSAIKKKDESKVDIDVSDAFEKIWDVANRRAIEAWVLGTKDIPLDFSDDEAKKYIDEKRERYICQIMGLKEFNNG